MGARDLDRVQFRVLDHEVVAFADLVAAALVLGSDRLAGFLIDELLRSRLPVALLICRKAMRSKLEHAACSAIGHETNASLR